MAQETLSSSPAPNFLAPGNLIKDVIASIVVFLVALPLCLGIALASGAPLFSGLLAGIIGGIIVGSFSGSHTSVSGPAAGLAAIVAAQITALGSFDTFLLAVMIAGFLQIGLGIAKAGALSAFFPSSVIKGLLAAIGLLLILKQIPHLFGDDKDPEGEMSFEQPDHENTFSEILNVLNGDIHYGAAVVGIACIALLMTWDRISFLKKTMIPGPLVAVFLGVGLNQLFSSWGEAWAITGTHLVQIPVAENLKEVASFLTIPDFTKLTNPAIYTAAVTIAIVASLETLLNLEAVDKLDPERRDSPPSRELIAQGIGNSISGLIGGLPITAVIVRGSVNVSMGAKSKLSAILHGILLLTCVVFLPTVLNMIPLSALAAILMVIGFKLASPKLFRQMWSEGPYQFIPFLVTVIAIIRTDLLIGILIGLGVSIVFILKSNLRRPVRRIVETHLDGDVVHVELSNQVSFLNRAALDKLFQDAAPGSRMLIDATDTDYIDPDVLSLIKDFQSKRGPANDVSVSLRGFKKEFKLQDDVQYADYSTRELQDRVTPKQVLKILEEGNRRFRTGNRISRDFSRQIDATAGGQTPMAAVLSCIDSRVPTELVFDLGIGDIFSVRVAGNVIGAKSLGSIEYAVGVAGVKLVLVMGHTHSETITSAVQILSGISLNKNGTEREFFQNIVDEVACSIQSSELEAYKSMEREARESFIDEVAKRNVMHTVEEIRSRSASIRSAAEKEKIMIAGALYDVKSGKIEFLS